MAKSGTSARDAPLPDKPKPEDYNSYNIDKKVRQECIEAPATIYPFVGGVLGILTCVAIAATPVTVGFTVAAFFTSSASFIWNYFVRGDELRALHREKLLALKREHEKALMGDLVHDCEKLGFAEGARIASAFQTAYANMLRYVLENEGASVLRFRDLAEQANREAYAQMEVAIDLYKALQSVDEKAERRELQRLRQFKTPDKATKTKIDSLEEMLTAYDESNQKLSELLARMSSVEAAMQKAYLQLVGSGTHAGVEIFDGAIGELQIAVEATNRLADPHAEDRKKRDEYAQHGRQVAENDETAKLSAVEAARLAEQRLLGAADADKSAGQTDRATRVE